MIRVLDKDGREVRRPLGFVERERVPERDAVAGAVSHTQAPKPQPPAWRGGYPAPWLEPHGDLP